MLLLLIKKLQQYATESKMELEAASFLLSLSGGVDSTTMGSLLLELRDKYKFKLGFVHINHNAHIKSQKVENYCYQYSQYEGNNNSNPSDKSFQKNPPY